MVERPIKKSERQPKTNTDDNSENLDSMPSVGSTPKIIKKSSDRSESKGKKYKDGGESVAPVNPALARGPKPAKPVAKVEAEPEEVETAPENESEPTSENPQE
jgi:hypothetical protein